MVSEPEPAKVETINTVDHKTGRTVEIPKESSSFSEAGGFLVRKYKGPKDLLTFLLSCGNQCLRSNGEKPNRSTKSRR